MPVLSSNLKHSINLSLTDLPIKLSNKQNEFDRAPIVSEKKYDPKVLIGNWFNRRASYISFFNKWTTHIQTIYKQHYKSYDINIYKKLPEQDLTKDFENLTKIDIKDAL
ncbi:uncharacterized protein LOC124430436 [Vespa crabro]|uniref:uncharacterized protein LOC124430436 n=1 Tax=Vespa crabro TaxID=7445 RepID=UPI001F01CD28|nr:uncharacterized protein LOC124430436 [Vespa crabro]